MSKSNKDWMRENTKEPQRENITAMVFFPLLYMQMDRKIIAVIAVSVSPETYGLGESGDRRKSQWKCTLMGALAKGIQPHCALVSLKVEKDHLLISVTGKMNEIMFQKHPKLVRKKKKKVLWECQVVLLFLNCVSFGDESFAAKPWRQFQVWWRIRGCKEQA